MSEKAATNLENDPRWQALVNRDKSRDGSFYYSVRTTGVYCRPSCGARLPKPENVGFFESCGDAEAAGFRPCKRCKPDGASIDTEHAQKIAELCRLIEASETTPSLNQLAQHAGLSPYHLHRLFKSFTGLTPKGYADAQRLRRVQASLKTSNSVTEAIYDAGYNSSGRFYEKSNRMLGMTPGAYRDGGADTEIYFAVGECALGAILVAMSGKGVCAISLGDEPQALIDELQNRFPRSLLHGGDEKIDAVIAAVIATVENPTSNADFDLPLDIRGTAFQQKVWQALRKLPANKTVTYSQLAEMIGSPKAVRAVASACGANNLAVVIPCHRVIRTDGGMAGYRWGIERKNMLLERERGTKRL